MCGDLGTDVMAIEDRYGDFVGTGVVTIQDMCGD